MPFIPPTFAIFRVHTLNLDTNYSTLLGRYKIINDSPAAAAPQTTLDVLIARTHQVIICKTKRETQREVFNQLVNELRQIPKENEEQIKQGTLFLLGALVHRYFRIIKEYDDKNQYAGYTIWTKCHATDCKLFQAIRKALGFKELKERVKKFKTDDLKILDVMTIVKALEVFRDNMLLADEQGVPRYMKYPHFANDVHFKQYLQDIIDTQTERGSNILNQFQAIAFLQSLANKIALLQQNIEQDIKTWHKAVMKDYVNFSDFKVLDENTINATLTQHVASETSRNAIFDLFYTPFIQDNLDTMNDHPGFLAKMKEGYGHKCSYVLFGGYVLLLSQSFAFLDQNLQFSLQKALGLEMSLDDLTEQDKLNGVKFLQQFIEVEPDMVLDYEFFATKEKMNTIIARVEKRLTQHVAAQNKEHRAVALAL